MESTKRFMLQAIALSFEGMRSGKGGPFGAIVVKDGQVIGQGCNRVTSSNDPTAHAEIVAIREACKALDSYQLDGCEIYTSCEPCPMCMGAIYWARPSRLYYASTKIDAAASGFDDHFIEKELLIAPALRKIPMEQLMREDAIKAFEEWNSKEDKVRY